VIDLEKKGKRGGVTLALRSEGGKVNAASQRKSEMGSGADC